MFDYRKKLICISIVLGLVSGLSACGSGGGGSSPTPTPTSTPTPTPTPTPAPVPPIAETEDGAQVGERFHAEAAFYSGNLSVSETYVGDFSARGDRSVFTVNMASAADAPMALRFANTSGDTQSLTLYVNGLKQQTLEFTATGSDAWASLAFSSPMRAGINTVSIQIDEVGERDIYIGSLYVDGAAAIASQGKSAVYTSFEAEELTTNAEVLAPNTTFKTFASESSQRSAVKLNNTGDYVEFTSAEAATGLTLRYAIPDSADGTGLESTLGLYINGVLQDISLSSKHAWVYGNFPYSNTPGDAEAHRFFDERAYQVSIPKDATVRLQKDAGHSAQYYVIDLIELETIAPAVVKPEGYLDITAAPYAADATGVADATSAIVQAITDAKGLGVGVYIPTGIFSINNRLSVSNVHIQGAGIWYTTVKGKNGQGGFLGTGSNVTLTDLKIESDTTTRRDDVDHAGLEGNFGKNSLIQNVWIEHMKVGGWFAQGTDGLYVVNGRVRNTYADGFNLHAGVKNSRISHFNVRNAGDDAFAMWSSTSSNQPNHNNEFSQNTAQLPMLANAFALYGGSANRIMHNIGMDTVVSAAGIALSQRFDPHPFSGLTQVRNNSLYRTGGWDYGWNTSFGAVWVFTDGSPISGPIEISELTIEDAVYDGILVSYNQNVSKLKVSDTHINGTGAHGINIAVTGGELTLENVTIENVTDEALNNYEMDIVELGTNSGF